MRKRRPMSKHELIARLHRGLRPKLASDQVLDLGLVHIVNLDAIAKGTATFSDLWDFVGGILTWSRVADELDLGADLMVEQLLLAGRLVDRFERTGRVLFTGTDYQLAKAGCTVMDQLAIVTDKPTAVAATEWAYRRLAQMLSDVRHPQPTQASTGAQHAADYSR